MRTVTGQGRWVWGLAGLVTAAALAFSGLVLVASAGPTPRPPAPVTLTQTVTLVQPVTSLTVQSYGGTIRITSRPVGRVQVSETFTYGPLPGGQPAVTESATVTTDGGDARITFSAAPQQVTVSTGGGLAALTVPGGPYALAADSNGGPEWLGIATSPAAPRSLAVSTGGGPLRIGP